MITDRDICMAAATNGRAACQITVGEVIGGGKLFSCALNEDVGSALVTMLTNRVRRLPVLDSEGRVQGLLSINDVALSAKRQNGAKPGDITYDVLGAALNAICQHRTPIKESVPERSLAAVG